ncbi:hypothetical protein [Aquitalea pelogenes]|uniref:hypothetical protein n=1 Tax=Aquitalea pelogenes TaxID=1293573 RepID=UPI0035B3A780
MIKIKLTTYPNAVDILSKLLPLAATAQQDSITAACLGRSNHCNDSQHHLIVVPTAGMQLVLQQQVLALGKLTMS